MVGVELESCQVFMVDYMEIKVGSGVEVSLEIDVYILEVGVVEGVIFELSGNVKN